MSLVPVEVDSSQIDLQIPAGLEYIVYIHYSNESHFPVPITNYKMWLSDFKTLIVATSEKYTSFFSKIVDHKLIEIIRVYDDPKLKPISSFPFEDQYYDITKLDCKHKCHFHVKILTVEEHAKRTEELEKEMKSNNDECCHSCGKCLCCPCVAMGLCCDVTFKCFDLCDFCDFLFNW
jgi:hypothetical protein